MKNILITGVSGYFGQKLVSFFENKEEIERICGIDIKPPVFHSPKLSFVKCDVRADLKEAFNGRKIDCVIHTAYILPPIHDTTLMEDINVNGTKNVMNAAAIHGVGQILDCSSGTAYGFHPDNPKYLVEESPLRGNDDFTYAKNKKEIGAWIRDFEKEHPDILLTTIRPCFVVGPGFTNPLARHLCKKICILPGKTAPFQYIHEDDLVDIMYHLLKKRKKGIYNLAADGTMTFDEMIRILGGYPPENTHKAFVAIKQFDVASSFVLYDRVSESLPEHDSLSVDREQRQGQKGTGIPFPIHDSRGL